MLNILIKTLGISTLKTMSCLLVSGYRQHGKDFFYQNLKADNSITDIYDIYLKEYSSCTNLEILRCCPTRYIRCSI